MPDNPTRLKLYVGVPEENGSEYLYLDLSIPTREIPLWKSKKEISNCSGESFLKILSESLNEAFLWIRYLGVKLQLDRETIEEFSEEFPLQDAENIHQLLKEVLRK